jgi:hypothetical protein
LNFGWEEIQNKDLTTKGTKITKVIQLWPRIWKEVDFV